MSEFVFVVLSVFDSCVMVLMQRCWCGGGSEMVYWLPLWRFVSEEFLFLVFHFILWSFMQYCPVL